MGAISEGDQGGPIFYARDGRPECVIGITSFKVTKAAVGYPDQQQDFKKVLNVFTVAGAFYPWLSNKAATLSKNEISKRIVR